MKKLFITDNIYTNKIKNTSLALGFFDGMHIGHQKVLKSAIDFAKKFGISSTVLTFKNHPVEILYNVKPEFITTVDERLELFEKIGIDNVIMSDFTAEIAKMSANYYFNKIICNLSPKSISLGYNHTFGTNKEGNTEYLRKLTKDNKFLLDIINSVKIKNEVSSSTLIRNLIKDGNVESANKFLGDLYSVKSTVIKGMQRGRTMKFPTANLKFPDNKVMPRFGVYYGQAFVDEDKYDAIANIGIRPTFGDLMTPLLEINILDFNKQIYGKELKFSFIKKIRNEQKFLAESDLKKQIQRDVDFVRKNCL